MERPYPIVRARKIQLDETNILAKRISPENQQKWTSEMVSQS
jgi:hypothetical protein